MLSVIDSGIDPFINQSELRVIYHIQNIFSSELASSTMGKGSLKSFNCKEAINERNQKKLKMLTLNN